MQYVTRYLTCLSRAFKDLPQRMSHSRGLMLTTEGGIHGLRPCWHACNSRRCICLECWQLRQRTLSQFAEATGTQLHVQPAQRLESSTPENKRQAVRSAAPTLGGGGCSSVRRAQRSASSDASLGSAASSRLGTPRAPGWMPSCIAVHRYTGLGLPQAHWQHVVRFQGQSYWRMSRLGCRARPGCRCTGVHRCTSLGLRG